MSAAQGGDAPAAKPSHRVGLLDYALVALLLVIWLLPMLYRGMTRRGELLPCLPGWIRYQHDLACLFPDRVRIWNTFHVQGSFDGRTWFTLPDGEYAPMQPFGRRTRLDILLGRAKRLPLLRARLASLAEQRPDAAQTPLAARIAILTRQLDEMADWVHARHARLHPDLPGLQGVRFLQLRYEVGEPELASPDGPWRKRLPEEVPEKPRYELHRRIFPADG